MLHSHYCNQAPGMQTIRVLHPASLNTDMNAYHELTNLFPLVIGSVYLTMNTKKGGKKNEQIPQVKKQEKTTNNDISLFQILSVFRQILTFLTGANTFDFKEA